MAKQNKKKKRIILSSPDSEVMKWEVSCKDENVTNHLCRVWGFFCWREAKCYVQIDGHKFDLWMNVCRRQVKYMLCFCTCKMQITHKKEVKSPSLCFSLYNSGAVSCTHRKYKGWFTGAQVISGLRVNKTVLFKVLKILQQFWVKKR